MSRGWIAIIVLVIFLLARIYTFLVEGLSRADKNSYIMKTIVCLVTFAAIGGSHYGVFYGVNRMAWSEVE